MYKLYLAFQEMLTYVEPDPIALMESAVDRDRYLLWHRRFVSFARFFGISTGVTALAALGAGLIFDVERPNPMQVGVMFILVPPMAFLIGCLYGATLACLIAPRDFLLGPLGRKWMGFVGTTNIYVAKIVCIVVLAGMTYSAVSMTFGMIRGMQTEPATREKANGGS